MFDLPAVKVDINALLADGGIARDIFSPLLFLSASAKLSFTRLLANMVSIQSPLVDAVVKKLLKGSWDEGVFTAELLNRSIVPRNISAAATGKTITPPPKAGKPAPLRSGTYRGTKLALTQMMKRIETRLAPISHTFTTTANSMVGLSPSLM
jgi:hypothetical protein